MPSQTELLYRLGLDGEVVGITRFCIHPVTWFRHKTRIGGTKDIHPERIDALQPDLLIANKEENDQQQIEALASRYPVWISDIKTLPDALEMILSLGEITGRTREALTLANDIEQGFTTIPHFPVAGAPAVNAPTVNAPVAGAPDAVSPLSLSRRTAYLIWRDPYMAAGGDTFIHDMLTRCGLVNVFATANRYPIATIETLANTDIILLSSEPYPFKEKHIAEIKNSLPSSISRPSPIIRLVDGELFSWYGSRLLQAPNYFKQLQQELLKYPQ